jgi:hypothetical protein
VNGIEPSDVRQADIERDWPGWKVWKGVDNLFHGVRSGDKPAAALTADGESWEDLLDQIRAAETRFSDIQSNGFTFATLDEKPRGSL